MYMMAPRQLGWVVGLPALLLAGTARAAEQQPLAEETVAAPAPLPAPVTPPVLLGLLADAGVPDGANAALALRPASWLRVHAGGGTNTVSAGYRAGLTVLLPAPVAPSFSFEVGHFRDGDANGLVRRFAGTSHWPSALFEQLGYTYFNGQLGLELGSGPVQVYLHGGLSYLRTSIHNAKLVVDQASTASGGSTTVALRSDPIVRVVAPSIKLGLVVYLGSPR